MSRPVGLPGASRRRSARSSVSDGAPWEGAMSPLRRVFRYFFARPAMAIGTLAAHVVQILLSLALPLLLRSAIDNGLASHDYRLIVFAAVATMGLTVVRAVVWYFVSYNYARLSTAVSYTIRDQLYEKIQRNSLV